MLANACQTEEACCSLMFVAKLTPPQGSDAVPDVETQRSIIPATEHSCITSASLGNLRQPFILRILTPATIPVHYSDRGRENKPSAVVETEDIVEYVVASALGNQLEHLTEIQRVCTIVHE